MRMDVSNLCKKCGREDFAPLGTKKTRKKRMENKHLMREYVSQCGGKRKNKFSEAQPKSMKYHDVIDTFHPLPSPQFSERPFHFTLPSGRERALFINTSLSLPFCLIVNVCGIFPSKQRRRFETNVNEGDGGGGILPLFFTCTACYFCANNANGVRGEI